METALKTSKTLVTDSAVIAAELVALPTTPAEEMNRIAIKIAEDNKALYWESVAFARGFKF